MLFVIRLMSASIATTAVITRGSCRNQSPHGDRETGDPLACFKSRWMKATARARQQAAGCVWVRQYRSRAPRRCHGFSTIIMAKAFPKSTFVGYDFHPDSVAQARVHAEQHGATANTKFEVAMASDFPGKDLDLVTFFDCLHEAESEIRGDFRHHDRAEWRSVRREHAPAVHRVVRRPAAGSPSSSARTSSAM